MFKGEWWIFLLFKVVGMLSCVCVHIYQKSKLAIFPKCVAQVKWPSCPLPSPLHDCSGRDKGVKAIVPKWVTSKLGLARSGWHFQVRWGILRQRAKTRELERAWHVWRAAGWCGEQREVRLKQWRSKWLLSIKGLGHEARDLNLILGTTGSQGKLESREGVGPGQF